MAWVHKQNPRCGQLAQLDNNDINWTVTNQTNQCPSVSRQQLLEFTEKQGTLDTLCQVIQNHELETCTDISYVW